MKKHYSIVLLWLFGGYWLCGCVPVALVAAGATVGGSIVYDKRPLSTMAEDRNTASEVLKKISEDPELNGQAHITIATFNNLMLIAGQAQTQALRQRAYQIASNATGLKRIYNEITVQPPISTQIKTNDAWITTKVKSAMLAEKGLRSTQVKAVTEDSTVYLMGIVTHKQADLAADVASRVLGVQKVVRIFEYEH